MRGSLGIGGLDHNGAQDEIERPAESGIDAVSLTGVMPCKKGTAGRERTKLEGTMNPEGAERGGRGSSGAQARSSGDRRLGGDATSVSLGRRVRVSSRVVMPT